MSENSYVHRVRPGAAGQPIFFVFHGTGGDENQFFDFACRMLPHATIVSPRGDVAEHGAARFFRRKAEGVYDLDDLERATERMTAFIASHKAAHQATGVIGLGFSNGANILANLLIVHPDVFDASVLLHPLIPFEPEDGAGMAGRRVLITAGERDPICPVPLTQALADYLARQKAEVKLDWHTGGHEIRQTEIEAAKAFLAPYA
jgi:phospholipase/carboxylesterase